MKRGLHRTNHFTFSGVPPWASDDAMQGYSPKQVSGTVHINTLWIIVRKSPALRSIWKTNSFYQGNTPWRKMSYLEVKSQREFFNNSQIYLCWILSYYIVWRTGKNGQYLISSNTSTMYVDEIWLLFLRVMDLDQIALDLVKDWAWRPGCKVRTPSILKKNSLWLDLGLNLRRFLLQYNFHSCRVCDYL